MLLVKGSPMNGRDPFPDLTMRPVTSDDAGAIVAAFRSLSPQSIYRRFFSVTPDPGPLVERHLRLVDHHDHEALVVLDGDDVVGVAQWDRVDGRADRAEISITIVDPWQRRGLGRVLARALAGNARRHGIDALVATVLVDNRAALGLAVAAGPARVKVAGPEAYLVFDLAS